MPIAGRIGLVLGILAGMFFGAPSAAQAGGGPENLFLVVNSRSWASLTVANHFLQLRRVPPGNVLYLDWGQDIDATDVAVFREKILLPALTAIRQRGLGAQIDYLCYSTDLPYAINVAPDAAKLPLPKVLPPLASINGMTYFYGMTLTFSPLAIGINNNHYFQKKGEAESHGFRSWYGWDTAGQVIESGGDQYLLSTVLAYTSGRGNSVAEAVQYLQRSAAADGLKPKGTIYFMKNSDIRSQTRDKGFPAAVTALKQLGVAAEVVDGVLPSKKRDVQGAMIGIASFDWATSLSAIEPGAICEHFTSFGGILRENSGQTPLTEFLRYGAAGASGAVTEPYAIPEKFPSPWLQVHYARGCTLAESFYQAVHGPYQLLIVGDPLCRPWAEIPMIYVPKIIAGGTLQGEVNIAPTARSQTKVDRFEVFLDGVRLAVIPAGEMLVLDTAKYADGFHELRVVGITRDAIESQGRQVLPVKFSNHEQELTLSVSSATPRWGEKVTFTAETAKADNILLFQNGRFLGQIDGNHGSLAVEPREMGYGPVEIRAFAVGTGGPANRLAAVPISLRIEPEAYLPEQKLKGLKLTDGPKLSINNAKAVTVGEAITPEILGKSGVKPNDSYQLGGWIQAARDDVYQFQVRYTGTLKILVDSKEVFAGDERVGGWRYVPVPLARGTHSVEFIGTAANTQPILHAKFGGPGAQTMSPKMFQNLQ